MPINFAIIGVAGYIAPRHLRAIRDTHNQLIAAVDPNDSVGVLDQFSFETRFFIEIERFDRHLEKLRRGPEAERVQYISICSPNYLHDAHCRLALRLHANVICEKPLVINPWNLDALEGIEDEYGGKINTVMQLRFHPKIVALHDKMLNENSGVQHDVILTYVTARGPWYQTSWKGNPEKSGGIAVNIGIHMFDLLLYLFGQAHGVKVYRSDDQCMSGFLELDKARVRWFLSINHTDLPFVATPGESMTYRSITIDGQEFEFTDGSTDLHTRVYEETLNDHGLGIADARPSIELAHRIRNTPSSIPGSEIHPFLLGKT